MQANWNLRQAGITMALLTTAVFCWAQNGDTPIIIADGSLKLESAVPWTQFSPGDNRAHPHGNKSIGVVEVVMTGNNRNVDCAGGPCTVDVTYAGAHVVVGTGSNGKGLTMRPGSVFHRGDTDNVLLHNTTTGKISHVKITKGTTVAFEADASGGTKITIHYQ